MLQSFPLLAISLLGYVIAQYTVNTTQPWYRVEAFHVVLPSGASWRIFCGDIFQLVTLSLLFIEMIRSTRSDGPELVNHSLDVVVFITALTLFLTLPDFGNSTFFALLAMSLFDFVAGFIITTAAARRDISFESHHGDWS